MKRNLADKLYSIIVKRFMNEQPQRHLANDELSVIWYDLYGRLCRGEKYEDLKTYCETVKLDKNEKEEIQRGYA